MEYRIIRVFEDNKIIIYKRLFDLKNCCGEKRYFEHDKIKEQATGRQFASITQVKAYTKNNGK